MRLLACSAVLLVAVIGVGHLGRVHAKIYHENPGAHLAYVCDADERRAKSVAVEFDCEALGNVGDLPDDIDVCSIVVPTTEHCRTAVPLLERGVALYDELHAHRLTA